MASDVFVATVRNVVLCISSANRPRLIFKIMSLAHSAKIALKYSLKTPSDLERVAS